MLKRRRCHDGTKPSIARWVCEVSLIAAARRLTLGQLSRERRRRFCVNVGIVYVRPLSVKSNSPEGPLRHVPARHTVYFPYPAPYYAVAERWKGAASITTIVPAATSP